MGGQENERNVRVSALDPAENFEPHPRHVELQRTTPVSSEKAQALVARSASTTPKPLSEARRSSSVGRGRPLYRGFDVRHLSARRRYSPRSAIR
jgi:hypothetical protein